MLYLTRKIGESIIINNEIEVKVTEISGNKVKLGFNFPKHATILRKEIFDKIRNENINSTKNDLEDIKLPPIDLNKK